MSRHVPVPVRVRVRVPVPVPVPVAIATPMPLSSLVLTLYWEKKELGAHNPKNIKEPCFTPPAPTKHSRTDVDASAPTPNHSTSTSTDHPTRPNNLHISSRRLPGRHPGDRHSTFSIPVTLHYQLLYEPARSTEL
ncbi:hypothetical protein EYC80_006960 [Monilinia laxa]|uniref:Uncharacterized protein n=1 Tax=Monilinia laxa TaxID=61186 RepID=A0A5N6JZR1_MONLA|nr:hypothetical protein EYC80_006960 [Monilinia laxa]